MDYSKTVNLPQTDFPMKANLPLREPEFLKTWEETSVYQRMIKKNKGRDTFILHDGPPYANGHIHLGTALNKILKDIIIKYKSLSGLEAPYTPGWDCHGLPIEQQLMKELKVDKHKVGTVEFRKQAAAFAMKFVDIQRAEFKRLGILGDWSDPYLTLNPLYESVIVRVFGDLVKKGFIYRQKKPVYWCPTCETALADAEVEYAEHVSHSIYVKFGVVKPPHGVSLKPVDSAQPSVLIWTTTPWTLPANVALAFLPDAEYVQARVTLKDGTVENLVLSKRLLPVVAEKIGAQKYDIVQEFTGKKLEGIVCKNPLVDRESIGILADFVTLDDGTGVVHIAPGHGQEDYQAGLKYKLPIISPVDDRGVFTEEVKEFAGHKVFAANHLIIEKLKGQRSVLFEEQMSHSYPHCWRCKRAIIFRATEQWFLNVEHDGLRGRMLKEIKKVAWIPGYGENRITGMIESRPDWCLSRQRLWGVPIPVFYCENCGEPLLDERVIRRIEKLFGEHGSDIWFEKTVSDLLGDGLVVSCKKCKGKNFRKEQDIFDVWFDSGVSSEAVLGSGNFPELSWPADMYLEGSDQHRGWFQTSLIPAVAIRKHPPFRGVLTHGFVVDGEGKKMSKSLGNVIAPQDLIKQYGADILRLWVAASDYREDIRISPEIVKGLTDTYRKIRNTVRFLLGNTFDFTPSEATEHEKLREIDKYIIARLQDVVRDVTNAYDTYEFHRAATVINQFCTVDLSGFYLDSLKDTLYCDGKEWENRRAAQTVLWELCSVLTRLLAPILSYTSEETWQEMRKKDDALAESVFLSDFPKAEKKKMLPEPAQAAWKVLFELREKVLLDTEALRRDKKIGSTLGARVDVYTTNEIVLANVELLPYVFGTWDVKVVLPAPGQGTEVAVTVSKQDKCERCWRHTEDTRRRDELGGVLCERCSTSLKELNAKSGIADAR